MTSTNKLPSLDEVVGLVGGDADHDAGVIRGAAIADNPCNIHLSGWGTYKVKPTSNAKRARRELQSYLNVLLDLPVVGPDADNDNGPVDLWARRESPPLIADVLPDTIGAFADITADMMGVDAGGLAMAALSACAAAIPDSIKIQPKEHDPYWRESARIWTAIIGGPSAKKSPLISASLRPLKRIDGEMRQRYLEAKAKYDALDKAGKAKTQPPRHERLMLGDTTPEAAADVIKDSPNGVLLAQDELSGWFGSMEKYAGSGRGAQKDRAFWLEAFNGGPYSVDRVGRGSIYVPNLSASLVGGIQPELIRSIARDSHDDGLLQRLFPIVLRRGRMGKDVPMPDVAKDYQRLIERLAGMKQAKRGDFPVDAVRFSPEAQAIWREVTNRNFELSSSWEAVNSKLAAHFGKYDGMFARLCLVWHCIESEGDRPAALVPESVAARVRDFLFGYLMPHAIAFYTNVVGLSDKHDALLATAGWILAHQKKTVSVREARQAVRPLKSVDRQVAEDVLEQLDAFGWLEPIHTILRRDSRQWAVRSVVHEKFADRAVEEAERRAEVRHLIASSVEALAA